jgi:hypothetical protein
MRYVVNIETNHGEGIVFIEEMEDEYPLFQRSYIPFTNQDEWVIGFLGKCKAVSEFKDFLYKRNASRIVSIMLVPSFDRADEYIDLTENNAVDIAVKKGIECRVVMRDGSGELIGPGFVDSRVNIWVAKDLVYRAEFF